jgi:hypothetical protein
MRIAYILAEKASEDMIKNMEKSLMSKRKKSVIS